MQSADKATGRSRVTRLRLRISPAGERALRDGHPWVFADSVREQNRAGMSGELAVIYDRHNCFLAVGLFDPDSPIRVRVLHTGKPQPIDSAWWAARLAQAIERRRGLFDEQTNGYRLVNGESDGWPGLVLDRYDRTLVLKIYTAAWVPRLRETRELMVHKLVPDRLVLRLSRNVEQRLNMECLSAHTSFLPKEQQQSQGVARHSPIPALEQVRQPLPGEERWSQGGGDARMLSGSCPDGPVIFRESGLQFETDVVRGQKTGFFLDQRDNRRHVESLARGRRVLNAFSFSGGFSLYAARGGATSVSDLDISAHALASARRNFALNQALDPVTCCRREAIQADAFDWLDANPKRRFDLIVLDPPSFAKREAERTTAIHAYTRLASLGIMRLNRGGILVACSCSAHVTAPEFFEAVHRSAAKSGRKFSQLLTTGHAPDHPATFREAEYLKALYLRF